MGLALAGLLASLLVSAVVYWYTGWLFVFLFVPFVPFLFHRGTASDRGAGRRDRRQHRRTSERGGAPRRPASSAAAVRRCPQCGFASDDPDVRYCPRDGSRLE